MFGSHLSSGFPTESSDQAMHSNLLMIKCRSLTSYLTSVLTGWHLSIHIFKSALAVSDVVLVVRVSLSGTISPSVCGYQRLLRGRGTRILGLTELFALDYTSFITTAGLHSQLYVILKDPQEG